MMEEKGTLVKRTGTRATPEEVAELKALCGRPMIALQCGPPPDPAVRCHELALAHGLPEISGYYGIDLRDGEFVRTDDGDP